MPFIDSTLLQDVRHALRGFARRPTFMFVVVFTLALGLGSTTALFSLVQTVLLRPLELPEPDRLAMVWERADRVGSPPKNVVSPANFVDWQAASRSFAGLAGFYRWPGHLTGRDRPQEIQVMVVSVEFFEVLGLRPREGRLFAADDREGEAFHGSVVILSDEFWRRHYGRDPGAVGQRLTLDGQSVTVIGVAPPETALIDSEADVFLPTAFTWADRQGQGRFMRALGRLAPGITLDAAQAEMSTIAARLAAEHPEYNRDWGVHLVPLHEDLVGDLKKPLMALFVAVSLLLMIACANVAHLLLAQAAARQREIALRAALGAGRGRLVRMHLIESLSLAGVAVVAGLGLAWAVLEVVPRLLPAELDIPRLATAGIDVSVFAFGAGLALLTGTFFGLVPVLGVVTPRLADGLRAGGWAGGGSTRQRYWRSALVIGEIALAVVLVLGAGLLLRSFLELGRVDLGLDRAEVLSARVSLKGEAYSSAEARRSFFEQARERLAALPGVESASAIQFLPLAGMRSATGFFVESSPRPEIGQEPTTEVRIVEPGYFSSVGMKLLEGRRLDARDGPESPPVVVVNRTLASRFWPAGEAVGQRLSYSWGGWRSVEVVGVVGDARFSGGSEPVRPAIFRPYAQDPVSRMYLVMRTTVEPGSLAPSVERVIRQLDPELPVTRIRTLADYHAGNLAQPRLQAWLFGVFSGLALFLAAIGIYSLVAYSVVRRTREIGVRVALGARRAEILTLVLRHGLGLALAGVALGLAVALSTTHFLASLLFVVSPTDPLTFAAVPALLLAVALLASLLPARRAASVDPTMALRHE